MNAGREGPRNLVKRLAWAAVVLVAVSFVFASPSAPASGAGALDVPRLMELTLDVPATTYLPGSFMRCIARLESRALLATAPWTETLTYRSVCYDSESATPPPPPPPYHLAPPYIVLTGQLSKSKVLTIPILPCVEFVPDYYAVKAELVIDFGTNTGNVKITEDTTAPTNCSGSPMTGDIVVTPLLVTNDHDGDTCTDWHELGLNPELGWLNDPFNPTDCTAVLSADGLYEISHEFAGGYRRCMGAVDLGSLDMHVYCYTDSTAAQINPEGYPGEYGDGLPGAPPPGPDTGGGGLVYGDVDFPHTVLSGQFIGNTVRFSGCFEDIDGFAPLGDIYVQWDWNVQTGAGNSNMWEGQCTSGGPADTGTLQALKLATTAQLNGPFGDNDPPTNDRNGDGVIDALDAGDGVPDHLELRDDTLCGLRDPFNINDYYDVSIPRDGIIDQFNDIVGVINNYEPVGYTAGDPAYVGPGTLDNYDRRSPMTGGAGAWNRGSPDLRIDMFNDIVGVIGQYNPVGC